jgi:uncharacterized protein (DUF302 family)
MLRYLTLPLLALLLPSLSTVARAADSELVVRYSAKAKFENVREDLVNAITGRGLVVDHTSHVAKMLDRTGKDLGKTMKMYGEDQGQVFSFCSAVVSRATMEADPHNIAFCPYTIAVYSTLKEPGTVFVAYKRLPRPVGSAASKASLQAVETLLDELAREALNLPSK